jgi:hypothetical protein
MLDHDLRFKVETGIVSQIFMKGPGITVTAAMRAAPIGIHTKPKVEVGGIVLGHDRFGIVVNVLNPPRLGEIFVIPLQLFQIRF